MSGSQDDTRAAAASYRRLSVNINDHTAAALRRVRDRDGVSLTEAVRRLVGYGAVVDQTIRDGRGRIFQELDGKTHELTLCDDPRSGGGS